MNKNKKKKKEKKTVFLRWALNINDLISSTKKEKITEQINKKYPTLCICVYLLCVCKKTSYLQRQKLTNHPKK